MENVESMDNQKETAAVPFLPIGSVVLLKNGKKRVMVYGRKVKANGEDKIYDIWAACTRKELSAAMMLFCLTMIRFRLCILSDFRIWRKSFSVTN